MSRRVNSLVDHRAQHHLARRCSRTSEKCRAPPGCLCLRAISRSTSGLRVLEQAMPMRMSPTRRSLAGLRTRPTRPHMRLRACTRARWSHPLPPCRRSTQPHSTSLPSLRRLPPPLLPLATTRTQSRRSHRMLRPGKEGARGITSQRTRWTGRRSSKSWIHARASCYSR